MPVSKRQRPGTDDFSGMPKLMRHAIESTMDPYAQKQLSSIVKEQMNIESAQTGEVAYWGMSRQTGENSVYNYYNKMGYYNSSDLPLNVLDTMKRDSQVALCLAIIKYPITNLGFTVDCDTESPKNFLRHVFEPQWSSILRRALMALDYGFNASEKVWKNIILDIDPGKNKHKIKSGRYITLAKLKPLHPRTVSYRTDPYGNFTGITQRVSGVTEPIVMDRMKSMITTYQEEYGNYFGKSRMSSAYESWYWKQISTQFFLRWMERKSIPANKIRYPKGQSKIDSAGNQMSNQAIAMRLCQILSSYGNVALPSDRDADGKGFRWDIEAIDQGASPSLTLKDVIEEVWNLSITRGMLIPDAKSLAALDPEAATEIFLSTLGDFVEDLEESINRELVQPLLAWNFPKEVIGNCRLNIDNIDFQKRQEMRKLLSKILDVSATFIKQTGTLPFDQFPDMNRILEVLDVPKKPVALYQLRVYDPDGKDVTEEEKKKKQRQRPKGNGGSGPDKGEKTSGNMSRTGRNGEPRDTDKDDESNA